MLFWRRGRGGGITTRHTENLGERLRRGRLFTRKHHESIPDASWREPGAYPFTTPTTLKQAAGPSTDGDTTREATGSRYSMTNTEHMNAETAWQQSAHLVTGASNDYDALLDLVEMPGSVCWRAVLRNA